MRKLFHVLTLGFSLVILCALMSCNSTPTVPVPPPEMTFVKVSTPDSNYHVFVVGEPNAASSRDVVIVFNEDKGNGVLQDVKDDGSFSVEIAANVGDVLVVQVKRDNQLSSEEELVVPAP